MTLPTPSEPSGYEACGLERIRPGDRRVGGNVFVCDTLRDRLCPPHDPSYSPNGRRIAFWGELRTSPEPESVTGSRLAFVRSRPGGPVHRFPQVRRYDREPAWSPSGSRLVFSGSDGGEADLYVMDVGTGTARQLTAGPGDDREPAWSTRGLIAFRRGGDLYTIRPNGEGLGRLTVLGGREPNWSPDGKRIVYRRRGNLFILSTARRHGRRITRRGGMDPAWSPSGRSILFSRPSRTRQSNLYVIRPDGSHLRRLLRGSGEPGDSGLLTPDWQPLPRR